MSWYVCAFVIKMLSADPFPSEYFMWAQVVSQGNVGSVTWLKMFSKASIMHMMCNKALSHFTVSFIHGIYVSVCSVEPEQ